MAITSYSSSGNLTMNESGSEVDFHMIASEVLQLQDDGWKLVHSIFAPLPDCTGVPQEEKPCK